MGKQGKRKGIKMINEVKKHMEHGLSSRQISRTMRVSRNTVKKYMKESALALSGPQDRAYQAPWSDKVNWIELRRKQSMGTQLAHYWERHIQPQIEGLSYNSFWREFRRRYPHLKIDMHQTFIPGERSDFDYKGKDPGFGYTDLSTGEFVQCRLFGMILPSSQLLFSRATLTEKQEDTFPAIALGFEFFGGVTSTMVFDNSKVQVTKADNFDPDINSEFSLLCDQYNIAPLATRPNSPKDKSLIENVLGVFWRWSWPQLRELQMYSLSEVNSELERLTTIFNDRTQKKYGLSRREKFESYEKEKLKPLPERRYEGGYWKKVKVHPDCHIQVHHNFYSVPYKLRGKALNVRMSQQCLEVFSGLERVAIHHMPIGNRGRYFTTKAHLPESHQAMLEKTPKGVLHEASTLGENIHKIAERLIKEPRHPLMYLRRLQGILNLRKRYSTKSLEESCSFFLDASLSDIRVRGIEDVISAKSRQGKELKVKRQPNENLRGHEYWTGTYH